MMTTTGLLLAGTLELCASIRMPTPWSAKVDPKAPWPEYPRPHLVRDRWMNLNGSWQFETTTSTQGPPASPLKGSILVPFPMESDLSGVAAHADRAWYKRTFTLPPGWKGDDVQIHFGASDWETEVYLNGKSIGVHQGGYDAFTFDLTAGLVDGVNELALRVWDPTGTPGEAPFQPMGKQSREPGGIFYTSTTGPWQTVWLEPLPHARIEELTALPGTGSEGIRIRCQTNGTSGGASLQATARDRLGRTFSATGTEGRDLVIPVPAPLLWSPEDPHLYRLEVRLVDQGKTVDSVGSYAGLRDVGIRLDGGFDRFHLNGKPLFLAGPLDQGFWPDGIYTPPTDEAMRWDLATMKAVGFNMVRKHIKVESERWFYLADSLGLAVWQDVVSPIPWGSAPTAQGKSIFEREMRREIQSHLHHPSIVQWIVFNEGWVQFDDPNMTEIARNLDTTRIVSEASGWNFHHRGQVKDIHTYETNPICPTAETGWMTAVGEFGGIGLHWKGHEWSSAATYRWVDNPAQLLQAWTETFEDIRACAESQGISAAVATQWTDVEMELNGFWTYDRQVAKLDSAGLGREIRRMVDREPVGRLFVPTSQFASQSWRFSTTAPGADWAAPSFDDRAWKTGNGAFGTKGTPVLPLGTDWNTPDLWLRKTVRFPNLDAQQLDSLRFFAYHDEDMEIYVNGVLAVKAPGYTQGYHWFRSMEAAKKAVLPGRDNVIAVHCRQTAGGQGIDVGVGTRDPGLAGATLPHPSTFDPKPSVHRRGDGSFLVEGTRSGETWTWMDVKGRVVARGRIGTDGIIPSPPSTGIFLLQCGSTPRSLLAVEGFR